jgi:hypothetical protein
VVPVIVALEYKRLVPCTVRMWAVRERRNLGARYLFSQPVVWQLQGDKLDWEDALDVEFKE